MKHVTGAQGMPCAKGRSTAILLATYNGSRYVCDQISSLKDNRERFTLHWLDDHSLDDTRAAVEKCAAKAGISLRPWHHSERLGVPAAFFRLLECVEADVYLFCDQDDIWQPGKIDATVEALRPDRSVPALAFTDTLIFEDNQPHVFSHPILFSSRDRLAELLEDSKVYAFLPGGPAAHTQGFTRPLRELLLTHIEIARTHAAMHDCWMYDIAIASGVVRMLPDSPKVLYRRHSDSYCSKLFQSPGRWGIAWEGNQRLRKLLCRHGKGLLLASNTLPGGPRLDRVRRYARILANLDRRQSVIEAARLWRLGLFSIGPRTSMALNCMYSDAKG